MQGTASNDTEPLPTKGLIAPTTVLICNGRSYPIDSLARAEHIGTALIVAAERSAFAGVDFIGDVA